MGLASLGRRRSGRLGSLLAGALVVSLLPGAVAPVLGAADRLVFTTAYATTVAAGGTVSFSVGASDGTAIDTGFRGSVAIASSDPAATVVPASPYTYNGGDNGLQVFDVTFRTAGSQTVTFTSTGLTQVVATVTVTPGAGVRLAFVTQPSSALNGAALPAQPRIALQDASGNTVASDSSTNVTIRLLQPPAGFGTGTLDGCAATLRLTNGIAAFSGCRVMGTGHGFRLEATAGGVATATSGDFDVSSKIIFETQPGGGAGTSGKAQGGIAFSAQPKVTVLWPAGAGTASSTTRSLSDNTTTITLAIKAGTGASGATLTCDQSANTMRVTAGSAQFTNCRIDKAAAGYQIVATASPAFPAVTSSAFDVVAGLGSRLTFIQEPTAGTAGTAFALQPIVAITDAGGNVVTSGASATVVLGVGLNGGVPAGALTCTPSTAVATATTGANAGRAIFSGCRLSTAGAIYTLTATPLNVVCAAGRCTLPLQTATTRQFAVTAPGAAITLTAKSVITWGQTVTLTTRIATNGANKPYTIQASRDRTTWTTIATLTTDATGLGTFPYRPATNLYYRSVFTPTGSGDLTGGTSATARVVVRQLAVIRPHSTLVRTAALGSTVTLTTTVRPNRSDIPRAVVRYYIYRYSSGAWRLLTTRNVATDPTGVARLAWRFSSRGDYRIRSMALPTSLNANSVLSTIERYRVP